MTSVSIQLHMHYNVDDSLKHGCRLADTFAVEHPTRTAFILKIGVRWKSAKDTEESASSHNVVPARAGLSIFFLECNQLELYAENIFHWAQLSTSQGQASTEMPCKCAKGSINHSAFTATRKAQGITALFRIPLARSARGQCHHHSV